MLRPRRRLFAAPVLISLLIALPILAEVASIAAQQAGWTKHDLAYYLDANTVAFVRPGLKIEIVSAAIENSQISVRFKLTDPKGLPLDRDGVYTPGAVSTSFIAAFIPQGQSQYTAYTTRTRTSPINNQPVLQATVDSGGTYQKVTDGEYIYKLRTTVPATFDPAVTHTIGAQAARNLSEFDLGTQFSNAVFSFVPNGSEVKVVRDVVRTEACNNCHDPLAVHGGGARRMTQLCILCHTPQSTDDKTLNPIDFRVMVHKIHMGHNLPSVKAGKPYKLEDEDFSTVAFPNDVRRCEACHQGGTQSANYLTKPSRAACGACHDDVNFASGVGHAGGPQISDNLCATCHIPEGEMEFDASIKFAHTIPTQSGQLPGTTFTLVRVDGGAAGQKPTVTFTIKDKQGNVIDASSMNSLSLLLTGPTTDYASVWREDARKATRIGNDFVYTFTNAVPADARGTYAIGIEGYRNITLNPDTTQAVTARDAGFNQVLYFSVDGSEVAPRRKVVAVENCNVCHGQLALHGGSRRNTDYCVFCHNANGTDAARRKAETLPAESIHFKNLIHKIHTGEELTTEYTVFGFSGTGINFNEVLFPGDRRNCAKCHVNNSQQIPLPDGVLPTVTPRGYIQPKTEPIAAACLACHTSKPAAAHASIMTSPGLGESCAACHGQNRDFSVDRAHAR